MQVYVPTIYEDPAIIVETGGRQVDMRVWDTRGSTDEWEDKLRPLAYYDTDVFLIAYAIDRPESLRNVKEKVHTY